MKIKTTSKTTYFHQVEINQDLAKFITKGYENSLEIEEDFTQFLQDFFSDISEHVVVHGSMGVGCIVEEYIDNKPSGNYILDLELGICDENVIKETIKKAINETGMCFESYCKVEINEETENIHYYNSHKNIENFCEGYLEDCTKRKERYENLLKDWKDFSAEYTDCAEAEEEKTKEDYFDIKLKDLYFSPNIQDQEKNYAAKGKFVENYGAPWETIQKLVDKKLCLYDIKIEEMSSRKIKAFFKKKHLKKWNEVYVQFNGQEQEDDYAKRCITQSVIENIWVD